MPAAGVTLAAEDFMRQRMVLAPLPFRPDISLYHPTPRSGLAAWLAAQKQGNATPYWAYAWAGGAALAVYLGQNPQLVRDRTVLDFGSGSGLVGIAAGRAGARVSAFEPDGLGQAATRVNAAANGVDIALSDTIIDTQVVLAGDVFYSASVAAKTLPVLEDLARRGAVVLVGDPFRKDLPIGKLTMLAEYQVPDFGSTSLVRAGVFSLLP